MIKKLFPILFFCLILSIFPGMMIPVYATEEEWDPSVDLSDTALDPTQQEEFNEQVANYEDTIDSVIIAAQHKGRDVSFEGVHADKCIKLYGLNTPVYALGELCDVYSETGRIQSKISEDYSVLTLYVNEDGEYVDSFVFVRKENYPEAHDLNGWVAFGSGSLFASDTFSENYLKEGSFQYSLRGLGLSNTKNLKVISYLPNLSYCFYFEQEGEEFIIPMHDAGLAEIKAYQVYRVSDIVEDFWKPILEYEIEAAEKYKAEHPGEKVIMTGPQIPEYLPPIAAINLSAYLSKEHEPAANEPEEIVLTSPNQETEELITTASQSAPTDSGAKTVRWLLIAAGTGIAVLLVCGCIIIFLKKRRSA